MINTGDQLLCTDGNDYYVAGKTYVVGRSVNGKHFELLTECNDDRWYVVMDDEGIRVCFDAMKTDHKDALFIKVEDFNRA